MPERAPENVLFLFAEAAEIPAEDSAIAGAPVTAEAGEPVEPESLEESFGLAENVISEEDPVGVSESVQPPSELVETLEVPTETVPIPSPPTTPSSLTLKALPSLRRSAGAVQPSGALALEEEKTAVIDELGVAVPRTTRASLSLAPRIRIGDTLGFSAVPGAAAMIGNGKKRKNRFEAIA
ncbi:MAG TPA: hypothetical protein DIC34_09010 [Treponema sp.]|nr:hypothetical protein [Treponema sp.]